MNILTKKNTEILRLLNKEESYLREISEKLDISPGKVHSAIQLFKKNNLINEKKEKNKVMISLNKESPKLNSLLSLIEGEKQLKIRLKKREKTSHKGENGRVLIIGGSEDYIGAPALAGLAALRAGADLVVIAAPEKTAWAINELSPDLITKKLKGDCLSPGNFEELTELIETSDVIVIGPGLGKRKETRELVKRLLKLVKKKVVDAEAISAVNLDELRNAVITPHHGELNLLLKNNNLKKEGLQNKLSNNVVLLKGPVDEIISKDRVKLNKTGTEAMTKGGTGDVLTGIVASFLAQGNDAFDSAYAAAFINGKAGENLNARMDCGFLASELVKEIPHVIKEVLHG